MKNQINIGDYVTINLTPDLKIFGKIESKDFKQNNKFKISGFGDTLEGDRLEQILKPLHSLAMSAHSGTSFDPEKRGLAIIRDYSEQLFEDLLLIEGDEEKNRYYNNYLKYLNAWLSAKGRCISTMITGGSNFPVRRAEKANTSEHKRSLEFSEFRDKFFYNLKKRELASRTPQQINNEAFAILKRQITSSAATIIGIDNGTERGYSRALFVSSITKKIETVAKNGNIELLKLCLDLVKTLNASEHAKKPIITDKNKIWSLLDVAEAKRESKVDQQNTQSTVLQFSDGEIVLNYQLDRIQIVYREKPDR